MKYQKSKGAILYISGAIQNEIWIWDSSHLYQAVREAAAIHKERQIWIHHKVPLCKVTTWPEYLDFKICLTTSKHLHAHDCLVKAKDREQWDMSVCFVAMVFATIYGIFSLDRFGLQMMTGRWRGFGRTGLQIRCLLHNNTRNTHTYTYKFAKSA